MHCQQSSDFEAEMVLDRKIGENGWIQLIILVRRIIDVMYVCVGLGFFWFVSIRFLR